MKKYPYPDKKTKTLKEVELHYAELVNNVLEHLNISGYRWYMLMPGEDEYCKDDSAGASIKVNFPYKRFAISLQQDSINKALEAEPQSAFWINAERSMVHECIHILVWHFANIAQERYVTQREINDTEEELVDHLSIAFHTLLQMWRGAERTKTKKTSTNRKTA